MGDLKKKKSNCIYSEEITRKKSDEYLNETTTEDKTIIRLKEYMQEFYKMQIAKKEMIKNKDNKED